MMLNGRPAESNFRIADHSDAIWHVTSGGVPPMSACQKPELL